MSSGPRSFQGFLPQHLVGLFFTLQMFTAGLPQHTSAIVFYIIGCLSHPSLHVPVEKGLSSISFWGLWLNQQLWQRCEGSRIEIIAWSMVLLYFFWFVFVTVYVLLVDVKIASQCILTVLLLLYDFCFEYWVESWCRLTYLSWVCFCWCCLH